MARFYLQYAKKETALEHFGVVQLRISCTIKGCKYLVAGRNTRAAQECQLLESNTKWSKPTVSPDFISEAKVQTEQNNASLSKPPERNPVMVEINNVKVDCNIYGEFNIPRNFSTLLNFPVTAEKKPYDP